MLHMREKQFGLEQEKCCENITFVHPSSSSSLFFLSFSRFSFLPCHQNVHQNVQTMDGTRFQVETEKPFGRSDNRVMILEAPSDVVKKKWIDSLVKILQQTGLAVRFVAHAALPTAAATLNTPCCIRTVSFVVLCRFVCLFFPCFFQSSPKLTWHCHFDVLQFEGGWRRRGCRRSLVNRQKGGAPD